MRYSFCPDNPYYTEDVFSRQCVRQESHLRAWWLTKFNQQATLQAIRERYVGGNVLTLKGEDIILTQPIPGSEPDKILWKAIPPSIITLENNGQLWRWPIGMFQQFHAPKKSHDGN